MGVEVWSKFRPNFDPQCRSLVEVWSKFGRSLVEVWSKFGRSLVQVWSKFGRSFDTGGVEIWPKFRANFDPPVSKFGPIDDDRNNQTLVYFSTKNKFILQPTNSLFLNCEIVYFQSTTIHFQPRNLIFFNQKILNSSINK